jgi:serine/threonine-protein kinase
MVDERSDLFAAGIVLWELLSGRKMYKATPETPLIHQAQRGQAPPLRSLELPEADALQAIVRRALAERPDDRYQCAGELFEELYGYCIRTRQMASALRFGGWLSEHFSAEKLQRRRARERAIAALELGPPVVMRRIASTPPTASASEVAPPPMSPASSSRPPMLSSRPPLAHPSLSSKPPPFGGEPPPVAERSATIAEDPAAPSSRPSPAPRSSPPSSREPPSSAPATGPNMRIVLIAFALTFALMCLLAWLGVIRF